MPLLPRSFPVGQLGCTCTLLACPETSEALVVDPGDEAPRILALLSQQGWKAVQMVHTHAHFDHVLGTSEVARATGAETSLHREDRFLYDKVAEQLSTFGLSHRPPIPSGWRRRRAVVAVGAVSVASGGGTVPGTTAASGFRCRAPRGGGGAPRCAGGCGDRSCRPG